MKRMLLVITLLLLLIPKTSYCYQSKEGWKDISDGMDEIDLKTVAIDSKNPDVIYVGSTKSIFKSSDGGKNWQKLYLVRGDLTAVNIIAIDPKDSNIIYAGTQNGLYRTPDGGITWDKIFEGMGSQEKEIRHMAIEPIDPNKIYLGTGNGIFVSNDAGKTWEKLTGEISNQGINFIIQNPFEPNIIYIAALTGVFKTMDGGISWERIFTATAQTPESETEETSYDTNTDETATYSNKTPNCIAIDNQDNNKIYIGTNSGGFISCDAGKTWDKLTSSGLISRKVTSLLSVDNCTLYAATNGGVFRISKPYNRWEEIYIGLLSKNVRYLAYNQNDNSILAATKKGIYKTCLDSNSDPHNSLVTQDPEIKELLARFEHEPGIQEIQEVAIRYAEVHNEKIKGWRKSVKQKAMLPKVSVGIDESEGDYYYSGTWRGKEGDTGWDLSLTWDLSELIWNSDQTSIDTRSRLMVQLRDDILNEVTRLYFERRKLQIELLTNPPKNLQAKLEKELRLQELTAEIDALTGGYLSRRIRETPSMS